MSHRVFCGLALGVFAFVHSAPAQQPARPLQGQGGAGQRPLDATGRARLEQEIRRGFARAVRQRVGLNDDQMRKLGPVAMRYEQERRRLQADERAARIALRQSLRNEQSASSRQVDSLLQRMLGIQKRRIELVESEQRDLSIFMTPLQRARYMALQEQFRQRVEQMRQRRLQLFEGDSGDNPVPARRLNRRPSP